MITVHTRTVRGFVFPLTRGECRELAYGLLDALDLEAGELELCLVDDVEMSGLHEHHLGGIGPTNVLAFPNDPDEPEGFDAFDASGEYEDGPGALESEDDADGPEVFLPDDLPGGMSGGMPGDFPEFVEPPDAGCYDTLVSGSIVFSVDALYRECVLYGQEPHVYFARLLAHALLHLTGVPHGEFMEERMDDAVEQVLRGAMPPAAQEPFAKGS